MSAAVPGPDVSAYVGPRPYLDNEADRRLFFARSADRDALGALVLSERLSVLYARSGLGKTSLINAGLLEHLRGRGFFPVVARVAQPVHDALQSLRNGVVDALQRGGVGTTLAVEATTLWTFFDDLAFRADGSPLRLVVILDQFEELFTLVRPAAPSTYLAFVAQLADIARGRMPESERMRALETLENLSRDDVRRDKLLAQVYQGAAPDVRILLSVREDFLPELQDLEGRIPGIFRSTYRLRPFTRAQAEEAIQGPLSRTSLLGENAFRFGKGAVALIVEFLSHGSAVEDTATEGSIEPFQLQLLCSELDQRRRERKRSQIDLSDLGKAKGMTRVISRYYTRTLRRYPWIRPGWSVRRLKPGAGNAILFHRPRKSIQDLCERGLLTRATRRNSLIVDEVHMKYGVGDEDLGTLVNRDRLLRSESRLKTQFYELSHDTLVKPISDTRFRRRVRFWGTVLPVVIGLLAGPSLLDRYEDHRRYEALRELRSRTAEQLRSLEQQTAVTERNATAKGLLKDGVSSFEGANLEQIDLRNAKSLYRANFRSARMRAANLSNANLGEANFQVADLTSANLSFTFAVGADFRQARLVGANLSGANVHRADFRDADLSGAQLVEVAMEHAQFAGARMDDTNLRGTEWWFAAGWSDKEIADLRQNWKPKDVLTTGRFKSDIEQLASGIETSKNDYERGLALNNRAWYLAVRGANLSQAQSDSTESVRLLASMSESAMKDPLALAGAQDTLGFILLQRGQDAESAELLGKSARALRGNQKCGTLSGPALESTYRHGVALERIGLNDQASEAFACAKSYTPTYERLWTPRKPPQKYPAPEVGPVSRAPAHPHRLALPSQHVIRPPLQPQAPPRPRQQFD